ncbi:MAG: nitroreductase family protein [Bacteroidales bacterium]
MKLLEVIKTRRSIRKFRNESIEEDKMHTILESANPKPYTLNGL